MEASDKGTLQRRPLLPVLWKAGADERPPHDTPKVLGTALAVIAVGMAMTMAGIYISDPCGMQWPGGVDHAPATYRSIPVWLQRTLLWTVLAGYTYYIVQPWIIKRPPSRLVEILVWLIKKFPRRKQGGMSADERCQDLISFSNSASVKVVTPSSLAFSYFEPGSVPTTT
jgi:hypothetical protein